MSRLIFIFAHGAGADSQSDFMQQMSELIGAADIEVIRFNFPYMDKRLLDSKRRPPDRADKLLICFQQQVEQVTANMQKGDRLFIGGKSMGGRMASLLMAQKSDLAITGGIGFGFPFHAVGKEPKDRLDHFSEQTKPFLFLQGERDTMGNKEEVAGYNLPTKAQVVWLADGNHDLKPRVKSGFTHQQHIEAAAHAAIEFMQH